MIMIMMSILGCSYSVAASRLASFSLICLTRVHLKLTPYFLVTCGECIDATESKSGTSFSDRFRADVTVLSEQNSVASKKAASVSDCRYSSCSFDSMKDIQW